MASFDGSLTIQGGSDEVDDILCGLCKPVNVDAKHYCLDCKKFLCDGCRAPHFKIPSLKSHKILSGPAALNHASLALRAYCNVKCHCDQSSAVEFYCEQHDTVICSSCDAVKHRSCRTVPVQDKIATYTDTRFNYVMSKAKDLKNKVEQLKQKQDADRANLGRFKDSCAQEIRNFRIELNTFLDKLEKTIIEELDSNEKEQKHAIDRNIESLEKTLQLLDKENKILKQAKQENAKESMFAVDVQISKKLLEYESLVAGMKKDFGKRFLKFQRNKVLSDMTKNVKSLGFLKGNDRLTDRQKRDGTALSPWNIEPLNQVNIKLLDDKTMPSIVAMLFMPNGYLVLSDEKNWRLKVLDTAFKPVDCLKACSSPFDLSVKDDSNIIVTFPFKQLLQFVQVFPSMIAGHVIRLDKKCFGVEIFESLIFASCHNHPGDGEVRVLDLKGKLVRRLGITKLNGPCYLALGKKNKQIYVSDWGNSTVTCMSSDGGIIYQYKDESLPGPEAMLVDAKDQVFVCHSGANNVQVINDDGKKDCIIVKATDGMDHPIALAFRESEGKLVVGCLLQDYISCFRLS